MELKSKLFKVNGSLDSILSPMNLDLLLPSLMCFFSSRTPSKNGESLLASFVLPCFHFLFLLRRKSAALGFNIKILVEVGTLLASYRGLFTNQMMSKYYDLNYLSRIRPSSFLWEIKKFWFGPQPCQKQSPIPIITLTSRLGATLRGYLDLFSGPTLY